MGKGTPATLPRESFESDDDEDVVGTPKGWGKSKGKDKDKGKDKGKGKKGKKGAAERLSGT